MAVNLPFPVSGCSPDDPEYERWFREYVDYDFQRIRQLGSQVRLLSEMDSGRVKAWAWAGLPPLWPDGEGRFRHEERWSVPSEYHFGDEGDRARVRHWLFERGIPYRRTVYLMYPVGVIETSWRVFVRHWDSFTHSVGFAMIAVDSTLQWAGCFHHEQVFVFGSNSGFRKSQARSRPAN